MAFLCLIFLPGWRRGECASATDQTTTLLRMELQSRHPEQTSWPSASSKRQRVRESIELEVWQISIGDRFFRSRERPGSESHPTWAHTAIVARWAGWWRKQLPWAGNRGKAAGHRNLSRYSAGKAIEGRPTKFFSRLRCIQRELCLAGIRNF